MGGPATTTVVPFVVPPGEASRIYEPSALAARVENFVRDPRGGIRSIDGPAVYEPRNDVVLGRPHGLFHAGLEGGIADTLLLRAGGSLYRHAGWGRNWQLLLDANGTTITGLSDEFRTTYPDQFVAFGRYVVWTNGIDRARLILPDRTAIPLGFDTAPSAPEAQGPERPEDDATSVRWSNHEGYSWHGRIGSVGDAIDEGDGAILTGAWYYWAQLEDLVGNLSPLSVRSAAVYIHHWHTRARQFDNVEPAENPGIVVDDLLRQFIVRYGAGSDPAHAVAFRLARSKDARRNANDPRFLVRIPGTRTGLYPDSMGDSELGPEVEDNVPVPVFRVMCAHQGKLTIGNTVGDPGIVRESLTGFAGTFPKSKWTYPDSGGAEVTAVASYGGRRFAWTESSIYDITDIGKPQLAGRFGCSAPRSVGPLPDGKLGWLSRDGFIAFDGSTMAPVSKPIDDLVQEGLNWSRIRRAASSPDPRHGQYLCAVAPAGRDGNRLILVYDGGAWKRYDLDIEVDDICVTDDMRRYVLAAGRDAVANTRNVFVLDHEANDYTPPVRTYRFRSGWMRADEHGMLPMNVRTLYICLADASSTSATYEFYADGSYAPVEAAVSDLLCIGPDASPGTTPVGVASRVVTDIAGSAVIGISRFHVPRRFWRKVPVNIQRATEWAFEIRTTNRIHLLGFAFDIGPAGSGKIEESIPRAGDV